VLHKDILKALNRDLRTCHWSKLSTAQKPQTSIVNIILLFPLTHFADHTSQQTIGNHRRFNKTMFTPGSSRKRQQRRENEDLSIDSSDETCASDNSQMDTDEESHEAHPSVEESFRIDEDDYDTSYAGEGSLVTDPNEHSSDQDSNGDPTEEGYDEAIEVMPRHVVYDKDFPQISQDLSKLATSVCGIIERSGCDNDRSKGCLEKAQRLTKTPDAEKEIVALIGDSGVGKSSLINSLIGIPKLARAVSSHILCYRIMSTKLTVV
jgi:hypothetical protein